MAAVSGTSACGGVQVSCDKVQDIGITGKNILDIETVNYIYRLS